MDKYIFGMFSYFTSVDLLEPGEHVRVLGELLLVDLAEVVDHRQPEALPDRVVVRQPVVAPAHDVQRRQVASANIFPRSQLFLYIQIFSQN